MKISKTTIEGCFEIVPTVFEDERGYFFEKFNAKKFEEATGVSNQFVQDNESFSTKGVLRGLHFQNGLHAQAKLVSVLQGAVLDVAVDLRPESKSFGKVYTVVLTAENKNQLYIPRGCAHGFVVLSDTARFFYKCDNFYHKPSEDGIIFNDTTLQVDWKLPSETLIISEKDKELGSFESYVNKLKVY